ncbi:uncharacterized protein ANIA_11596 [Aspergillus nidulans FGSC A4]|uniref:Uncharacterized protein n=1 Tax=Emericella nidulans (strain FGSC A4 / ATCC 38163 / CBS 112.46 / NRRL 194 / M139) TaxID=227321 RepID=C8V758_EMENI|nr:hypothetical protein [Aspergillus nidulans FGSC A4]CBF74083.1 TPA: hypothetical protein ANIA_11596 [Aspergillus nidulans FGSC A4]
MLNNREKESKTNVYPSFLPKTNWILQIRIATTLAMQSDLVDG